MLYFREISDVDVDYKNVTIAPIFCNDENFPHGKIAIIFYQLNIINRGDSPITIKSVELSCSFNGARTRTDSYVIQVGELRSGDTAAVLSNGIDQIVLMGWKNIRPIIGNRIALLQGGVLSGTAVFIVGDPGQALPQIDEMQLIVSDYSGGRSKHNIEFSQAWLDGMSKGFILLHRRFTQSESNEFLWQ